VKFSMVMKVGFGDSVRIIGAHPLMGEWDVNFGLTMEWGEGDCWTCEAMLPEGTYDFKVSMPCSEACWLLQPQVGWNSQNRGLTGPLGRTHDAQ
jgi:hypothetical protein